MDIRELRYFVQIVRNQNYSNAAKQLYVSQPALSKIVKKIENEIGEKLLTRSTHQVMLTDYGKIFYERALITIQTFDSLKNVVKDTKEEKKGKITIGVTPMVGTLWLVDYIVDFCNSYPNIEIFLNVAGSKILQERLLKGQLNLAIGIIKTVKDIKKSSNIKKTILLEDKMYVCMNNKNILSQKEFIFLKDLEQEEFNFYDSVSILSSIITENCLKEGFTPKIIFSSSNVDMIVQFTAHGRGICIVPRPYANRYNFPDLVKIPLKNDMPWIVCVMENRKSYNPYICDLFKSYIIKRFSQINISTNDMKHSK